MKRYSDKIRNRIWNYYIRDGLLVSLFVFLLCLDCWGIKAEAQEAGKVVYVVYDASQSMLYSDRGISSPWGETAYAVQMLAGLLDDNDRMELYIMTGEEGKFYRETINGETEIQGTLNKTEKILKNIVYTKNTYVETLEAAVTAIENEKANEKYLVIFTDGDFDYDGGEKKDDEGKKTLYEKVNSIITDVADKRIPVIYMALSDEVTIDNRQNSEYLKILRNSDDSDESQILDMFIEAGNYVFGRQELEYTEKELKNGKRQILFTTELPLERLMLVVQREGREEIGDEITADRNMAEVSSGGFLSLTAEDVQLGGYRDKDSIRQAEHSAWLGVYRGKREDNLLAPGTYSFEIPDGSTVSLYGEYCIRYQISAKTVSGINAEVSEDISVIAGDVELTVELIDAIESKPISENASVYDKLSVDLQVVNINTGYASAMTQRGETLQLEEGLYQISGSVALEGNYPEDIEKSLLITHQVGQIVFEADYPNEGLDIDALSEGKNFITLRAIDQSNRENISDIVDLIIEEDDKYTYQVERGEGCWYLYPNIKVGLAKDSIGNRTINFRIVGKVHEQTIDQSSEVNVQYSAFPLALQLGEDQTQTFGKLWMLFSRRIHYSPLLNGKPVKLQESGVISNASAVLYIDSDSELTSDTIVSSDRQLEVDAELQHLFQEFGLWEGGTINGHLQLNFERYGEKYTANWPVVIQVRPVQKWIRWMTCITMVILCLLSLRLLVKTMLNSRLRREELEAYSHIYCGEKQAIHRKLPVRKHFWHNLLSWRSSRATIMIGYLGIADAPTRMIVEKRAGGECQIRNQEAYCGKSFILRHDRPLQTSDIYFRTEYGMRLRIVGKYNVDVIIGRGDGDKG